MKTHLPCKYPWKSSREPLGVREPQIKNHWSKLSLLLKLLSCLRVIRWSFQTACMRQLSVYWFSGN